MEWFQFLDMRVLKNDVPQVHFREIKEGTHDITYRQPTEVAKYLFDFIK
jgi:hypothetical protein